MQFTFQMTIQEVKDFDKAVWQKLGNSRLITRYSFIPFTLFLVVLGAMLNSKTTPNQNWGEELFRILPFTIGAIGLVVCMRFLIEKFKMKNAESDLLKSSIIAAPMSIHLSDEGVKVSERDGEHVYKWHSIQDFWENEQFFALMLEKHLGIAIPKRVFATKEDEHNFSMNTIAFLEKSNSES